MAAPIVVGVDGSDPSLRAVTWAAREAILRNASLHLVHVTLRWAYDVPLVPQPAHWGPAAESASRRLLRHAAEQARAAAPGVPVSTEIADGATAEVIIAAAETAQMIVAGSRGRGGFAGLLLGSVSRTLADRSPCPVVIVGEQPTGHGAEIAVGVTGRPGQGPVLEFAFQEATLRGLPLRMVHAWIHPATRAPGDIQPLVYDVEGIAEEEARLLAESIGGWRERFPDVPVFEQVVHEHPARALIDASASAELVIVGTPGPARFSDRRCTPCSPMPTRPWPSSGTPPRTHTGSELSLLRYWTVLYGPVPKRDDERLGGVTHASEPLEPPPVKSAARPRASEPAAERLDHMKYRSQTYAQAMSVLSTVTTIPYLVNCQKLIG